MKNKLISAEGQVMSNERKILEIRSNILVIIQYKFYFILIFIKKISPLKWA